MSFHLLQDPVTGEDATPCLSAGSTTHGQACIGMAYSFDSLASNSMKSKNPHSGCREVGVAKTLDTTDPNPSKNQGGIAIVQPVVYAGVSVTSPTNVSNPQPGDPSHTLSTDPRNLLVQPVFHEAYQHHGWRESEKAGTLTAAQNDHVRGDTPLICEPVYCLQGNGIDRADTAGCNGKGVKEGVSYTLNTIDRPAVSYLASGKRTVGTLMANAGTKLWLGNQEAFSGDYSIIEEHPPIYIVRRLTPTECARLQGFADRWGDIEEKKSFTPEEYEFWLEVRNTHAAINGKQVQDYTEKQMLAWYNKLHTDSAEYKMWGNGIALPPALYCMQGIVDVLNAEDEVTDLSDAPEEIKQKILDNAEALEEMAEDEDWML